MIDIKSRWQSATDRGTWNARGASFVAKLQATKAVWFPPTPEGAVKKTASTAKKTSKRAAKKTTSGAKRTSGAARKTSGTTKKAAKKSA